MRVGRVLILDDDVDVAFLMAEAIRRAGHEAEAAIEPHAFFEKISEWQPDCIVLDLIMPEQDGVEIMRHLADMECNVRIVVVSGMDKRVTAAAARAARERGLEIAATLAKPFSIHTFTNLVLHTFYLGSPLPAYRSLLRHAKQQWSRQFDITEQELRRALDHHEMELAFQPQVCCASHTLKGFEALTRWQHPEVGYISPRHFLPAFERFDMMEALTRRVFEQALHWFSRLPSSTRIIGNGVADISELSLGINVSARAFTRLTFADELLALVGQHGLSPDQVVLELSETSATADPVLSLDFLTRLRVMGFGLSIDDFGSAHSSLQELLRLPFGEIKVDRRFVSTLALSEESRSVVRAIITLGNNLGLRTVAEGVEDQETLDYLREQGCDVAQGYFICSPLPAREVARWIDRHPGRGRSD